MIKFSAVVPVTQVPKIISDFHESESSRGCDIHIHAMGVKKGLGHMSKIDITPKNAAFADLLLMSFEDGQMNHCGYSKRFRKLTISK